MRAVEVHGAIVVIPLTKGYSAIVDASDIDLVRHNNWCSSVAHNGSVYAVRRRGVKGPLERLHRVIMAPPPGMEVDHINGDPLDNRRSNLRIASHAQNMKNMKRHVDNLTGFKGVTFDKNTGKWVARIMVDGVKHSLGQHHSPEVAYAAYCDAAASLHGPFHNQGTRN